MPSKGSLRSSKLGYSDFPTARSQLDAGGLLVAGGASGHAVRGVGVNGGSVVSTGAEVSTSGAELWSGWVLAGGVVVDVVGGAGGSGFVASGGGVAGVSVLAGGVGAVGGEPGFGGGWLDAPDGGTGGATGGVVVDVLGAVVLDADSGASEPAQLAS